MKGRPAGKAERKQAVDRLLSAVPVKNAAAEIQRRGDAMLVSVPMQRPRWLVPPLSWIIPFSDKRRVQLDALGSEVVELCDGKRTVEEVIETFSGRHRLSFREAQVAVTEFLRMLLQRGVVALVGR